MSLVKDGIIPTWWATGPAPGNFGDILTPILIKELFGYSCTYTHRPFRGQTLIGVGSILNKAENRTVVWGSGAMRASDPIKRDAIYLSVRGPHTRDLILNGGGQCPSIFGDPALIMPKIYTPTKMKTYKYGLFTHYVDYEQVSAWYKDDPEVLVINPIHKNPLTVIEKMAKCEFIISSSLHGIIIAHAYGVPAVWAKHSDKLGGDGIKFTDHYDSVGLTCEHVEFYGKIPVDDLSKFNYQKPDDVETKHIIKALDTYLHE